MIVFGFGKRTGKDVGPGAIATCPRCNNTVRFRLVNQRTWFTLFFIPVIPYQQQYLELCPICRFGRTMTKPEFDQAVQSAQQDQNYITNSQ